MAAGAAGDGAKPGACLQAAACGVSRLWQLPGLPGLP